MQLALGRSTGAVQHHTEPVPEEKAHARGWVNSRVRPRGPSENQHRGRMGPMHSLLKAPGPAAMGTWALNMASPPLLPGGPAGLSWQLRAQPVTYYFPVLCLEGKD